MLHQAIQGCTAALLFSAAAVVWAQDPAMPGMDHGSMSGMEHSAMPGTKMESKPEPAGDMEGMDPSAMPGMTMDSTSEPAADMAGMDHGAMPMSMQGGTAPADARDPHAYSGGEDFGPIPPPAMGDVELRGMFMLDQLEAVRTDGNTAMKYHVQTSFGGDYNRVLLKAEGERDNGQFMDAQTELLWSHAIATFWNSQLGARLDSGEGPDRHWLAAGVQGLAPYWFEVDATAYVGSGGRSAVQLSAEYEVLLTQRLILQPSAEVNFYGKRDVEREIGSGLSDVTVGARLRYEIRREFAPYVGVEWARKMGATADYARAAVDDPQEARIVAGLRAWY